MVKEIIISVYPQGTWFANDDFDDLARCAEMLKEKLKQITGIDFEIDYWFEITTYQAYAEIEPDVIDDELAEKINKLAVSSGRIEMEVCAEFPPER